jgi:hypothetical protein
MRGARTGQQGDPVRDAWIARVLGVRRSAAAPLPDAVQAELVAAAAALAPLPRPSGPPGTALSDALLASARAAPLPDDDKQLPQWLAALAPRFLAMLGSEPLMSDAALADGAPVAVQDQMLGIADLLDGVGRRLNAWAAALGRAEAAKTQLAGLGPDADMTAPSATHLVAQYDAARGDGLRAQQQVAALLPGVRAAYADALAAQPEQHA